MSFVSVKDVYKRYRMGEITINASDGISFDIEKGELVNCLFGTVNMSNVTTNNACIVLANPLFNPKKNPKHPFYPHKSSPAIDAGIIVPELLYTNIVELGGTKRIKGKTVDIGAYETLGPGTLFGVH